jgi:hypothetical protein
MSTEVYERISIEARDGIPQEAKLSGPRHR